MEEQKKIIQEDEIDLLELARVIWSKRGFILKGRGIFVKVFFLELLSLMMNKQINREPPI